MKTYYLFLFSFLFFVSCESSETETSEQDNQGNIERSEPTIEDLLSNRWVYKERVNDEGTKRIEFGDDYSERIIRIENNGHFMIYDSITDDKMINKGVPRIAKKSSGQWELLDNKLTLLHIENDTIRKEELFIDNLENGELITSSANRGKVTYYSLD
jgi:hypothetical protein